VDAARKRFTPEFINRLDKIVVFRPLGQPELRKILDIELHLLQQRIFDSVGPNYFIFTVAEDAKQHLLEEGTDLKYGARHLRRAIERLVVQPLSSLIATDQLRGGDLVNIGYDPDLRQLNFLREAEGMPVQTMAEMAGVVAMPPLAAVSIATAESVRAGSARSSRRA
jgi:ATP-dependent Clp protease ATP-binding subunit ClpA